jgi:hypothetical protein
VGGCWRREEEEEKGEEGLCLIQSKATDYSLPFLDYINRDSKVKDTQ